MALVVTAAPAEASAMLDVAGSTQACFGDGCTTFASTAGSGSEYDLTFDGTLFAATTDATGSASNIVLGSLTRGNTRTPSDTPALAFTLEVTFTLPLGIEGLPFAPFAALITGTSANGGGGKLPVDFDNAWQYFTFQNAVGSGSFYFAVANDPEVTKNNSNTPDLILGAIRDASFTAAQQEDDLPVGSVPEPGTALLLGLGAAILFRYRRPL